MTNPRRKLIEVALPLEAINREAAREKSIRHGHPSTLHLWWARRPLAAARAVIFAQMVDDPDSDPAYRKPDGSVDEDRAGVKRAELFNLIEELVKWENTNNDRVINAARAEIARCVASYKIEQGELQKASIIFGPGKGTVHPKSPLPQDGKTTTAWEIVILRAKPEAVNTFIAEHAPPFHDPFAGGGALPLEAQRLGLIAHASDLNPVAVMINKAMIEIPPRFAGRPPVNPEANKDKQLFDKTRRGATGLAEDVRYYGQWIRDEAEKRIGHLYPKIKVTAAMAKGRPDLDPYVGKELTVIAWLWARTVESSNPAYRGCHVPLVSSFWLSTKAGKEAYVEPVIEGKSYRFEVRSGKPRENATVDAGTKLGRGANFQCLLSQSPLSSDHIRGEFQAKRASARLMAIVAEGTGERMYISPTEEHETAARQAKPTWSPDQEFLQQALGFRVGGYGMTKWSALFTSRQLVALTTFSDLIGEARKRVLNDLEVLQKNTPANTTWTSGEWQSYADAVSVYLACAVSRAADYWGTGAIWESGGSFIAHVFTRNALPMTWDYPEANPFSNGSGNWPDTCIEWVYRVVREFRSATPGIAVQDNAQIQDISVGKVVSTDPPYYDNIGYADLSDYFYVWLRRSLRSVLPDLFATLEVPKTEELVATPYRHGGRENAETFFLEGMTRAMHRIAEQSHRAFPVSLYYAFKQSESSAQAGTSSTGWETFIDAVIRAGFIINGTWPMRTERPGRMRDTGSNALASSIVLVCRPRPTDAPMTTRKDFLAALRRELPPALRHLQQGNIAPVDLAQASIGPGMAVFSRYSRILETDGKPMTVRTALQLINQTLDETLAEQEGEFDSETAWAVAWFEQFAFNDGPFGDAETLSTAKNTASDALSDAGIIKTGAGKARLLRVDELPTDWDPATDKRFTVWEMVHHLIRVMNTGGETAAAQLVAKLGGAADAARELAYRLYIVCERRKRAAEALAYNALVQSWPEIRRLAREGGEPTAKQSQMFEQE